MLIRLRSRDGLERVEVPDSASVGDLCQAIRDKLSIPLTDIQLSLDSTLLTCSSPEELPDLGPSSHPLSEAGVSHGSIVFLRYPGTREVSGVKRSAFESRPFGVHMDVAKLVAAQTRIERQDAARASAASFDRSALDGFQAYIASTLAFSVKRGGILYGTIEGDKVFVHAIFEPPQQGSADSLVLERGTEEEILADTIAAGLGWRKVGQIFCQSTKERDFILSEEEVCQVAACQDEMGENAVTALVFNIPDEETGSEVHVEVFQDPKNKLPVMVGRTDVGEVDNDYFLVPLPINDHQGPLENAFPVENRLLPQGQPELRRHLQGRSSKPYVERISDFHLLLYLFRNTSFDAKDLAEIVGAVKDQQTLSPGYGLIIDSLAGI
ncbi:hypothetical protein H632_c274p1 [Helicosporidium sp. ATCC 50920]|nr:hypothetical protein H632_c274p1 [Helicosporidium sp. ATCC 50920]|eukprot:KDD76309.1 hypothetical protein H632_c274p1 [Helicosporidium sp. ATCC 50920]